MKFGLFKNKIARLEGFTNVQKATIAAMDIGITARQLSEPCFARIDSISGREIQTFRETECKAIRWDFARLVCNGLNAKMEGRKERFRMTRCVLVALR